MSMIEDTIRLLVLDGEVVTVRAVEIDDYQQFPAYEDSATIVETATALRLPKTGGMTKADEGILAETTDLWFFPYTSSASVSNRIYASGESSYYEILDIKAYEDHNEVFTKKVENR